MMLENTQEFYPWLVLAIILIGHAGDMLFTVLYLKKASRKYKNPEVLEINYHKWFFKNFGLIKGAIYSLCVSMTYMTVLGMFLIWKGYWYYAVFIAGMNITMIYVNYTNWIHADDKKNKLIKKDSVNMYGDTE